MTGALTAIHAPDAWAASTPGAPGTGTIVAVIDGGVDLASGDLASSVWTNPGEIPGNGIDDDRNGFVDDVHGWDFISGDADPSATQGDEAHGTHIAGLIAGRASDGTRTGVDQSARLMILRVCGPDCAMSAVTAALNYAVANGARVVNMSLSAPQETKGLADAIANAERMGVLVVAAAGNSGTDDDASAIFPASDPSPAVLAVTAVDDTGALPAFANWGGGAVDLAAPGVSVISTMPTWMGPSGLGGESGTSMATALAAGAAAWLMEKLPAASAADVRDQLIASATPDAMLVGRTVSSGVLDLAAAVGAPRVPLTPAAPPCAQQHPRRGAGCQRQAQRQRAAQACRRRAGQARRRCLAALARRATAP